MSACFDMLLDPSVFCLVTEYGFQGFVRDGVGWVGAQMGLDGKAKGGNLRQTFRTVTKFRSVFLKYVAT